MPIGGLPTCSCLQPQFGIAVACYYVTPVAVSMTEIKQQFRSMIVGYEKVSLQSLSEVLQKKDKGPE